MGPKRNFIVRGTDSSRKDPLAAPALCAFFVPGCSKLVVCVCLSEVVEAKPEGRGLPCRIMIGLSREMGGREGGASDNNTRSQS